MHKTEYGTPRDIIERMFAPLLLCAVGTTDTA